MLRELQDGRLVDGDELIADPADRPELDRWAADCYGRVLEVGLGLGYLARLLERSPRVTEHVVIERDPRIVERYRPEGVVVIEGDFPDDMPYPQVGTYDCITLDIARTDEALWKAAYRWCADYGRIFVRRIEILF